MRLPAMFVCLSVSKITRKRVHGFGWNVACRQMSGHERNSQLLSPIRIIVRIQEPNFSISTGYLYGRISVKFNGSIATGAWTNWLDSELDLDPGTGFTQDFLNFNGISEEVMDGFRWNFMRWRLLNNACMDLDEMLCVDRQMSGHGRTD